ncbi:MAG: heavy metal translocating P-type ATPase [Paracoccaceae bacterium]
MSTLEIPSAMACPGCVAAQMAMEPAAGRRGAAPLETILALPTAHCASCITTVETGLAQIDGVAEARVNLTLRRVRVRHSATVTPEAMIARLSRLGFEALPMDMVALSGTETDRRSRELLMRLGVAFFAMMNIMLLSVAVWSGASGVTRDMFHLISGAIALPTVAFAGQPFFRPALAALRAGRLGMDVPISLALILASAISVYETFHAGEHAYFDAVVMLTFFLLGGRYLDFRTRAAARSAAQELTALEVPRASRLRDGAEEIVAVSDLSAGQTVLIRPGGRIPVDGIVTEGASEIDRSLITGEAQPVWAGPGTALAAGEMNLTGPLRVRVTAAGRDTSLRRMAELVAVAEEARGRFTSIADRAARAYAPLVHLVSLASFATWMVATGGDLRISINISAAVLIITCPCALGLAVPAVVTAASGRLFRDGLLVKSGTALERLAAVDTVIFDKTGTLTLGAPQPSNLHDLTETQRGIVAALARGSAHPLAAALRDAAAPAEVTDIAEVSGCGISGRWQGRTVRLGRAEWVGAEAGSVTSTVLRLDGEAPVRITFTDQMRPGAESLVRGLLAQGIEVRLLSGDVPQAVREMAGRLGIARWQAQVLPAEKAAIVGDLVASGRRVLMVGDGLNDTGALAAASVSISPASALEAARVASDIVLLGPDIAPVALALRTARLAQRRIKENLAIAAVYNIVAVPVAVVGLATPLLAALAMSLSSITVTLNALRLKPEARWTFW